MALPISLPSFAHDLGDGIFAVDTGFQRDHFDAAYLVVHEGRGAFIDTGTRLALPRLLAALAAAGLRPEEVDWVIPTHVHLDHAGGAGALMRELPAATLLVHPRGAPHMIDPQVLWAGATAVYGAEEMARSYGRLEPVPAERVRASADGEVISLAGRQITVAHTPGHARHHHCLWDAHTRGWFTGDTFGLSYREFDTPQGAWVMPTSTPVQFEPGPLRESIERMVAAQPACLYLTHYGRVHEVPSLARRLLALLDETVDIGMRLRQHPERHPALKAALKTLYLDSLARHGCTLPPHRIEALLALDIELNAQGMGIWLDRLG